jgi:hypothetical protein
MVVDISAGVERGNEALLIPPATSGSPRVMYQLVHRALF